MGLEHPITHIWQLKDMGVGFGYIKCKIKHAEDNVLLLKFSKAETLLYFCLCSFLKNPELITRTPLTGCCEDKSTNVRDTFRSCSDEPPEQPVKKFIMLLLRRGLNSYAQIKYRSAF